MFEVLLQAERALSSGALDQAERSYWQLIELDPTNAIAVAGLARVSMQRGDQRLARTFADRALAMDPEMVSAKKILETLNGGVTEAPGSEQPDLPLLAAQRLEALGRRRAVAVEDESVVDERASGAGPGKRDKDELDETGRPLPEHPAEPPAERRKAGRQAAAAAEAAPRPQASPRPKAHQALGDRARRNLVPEDLKPRPRADDPFAAAESAAAIEAVDETDDVVIEEHVGRAGRARSQAEDKLGEVLGAVDATGEDESIAMRVALVADAAELEAAEMDAATFGAIDATGEDESIAMRVALVADAGQLEAAGTEAAEMGAAESRAVGSDASAAGLEPAELESAELNAAAGLEPAEREAAEREAAELDEGVFGVAELVAAEELGPAPSRRIDLDALEADLRAAELRAALREAGEHDAAAQMEAEAEAEAELMAAELTSAELATAERASEWIAEAEADAAQVDAVGGLPERASEWIAEAEADAAQVDAVGGLPERASEWIAEAKADAAQVDAVGGLPEPVVPPAGPPSARPASPPASPPETGEEPTEDEAEAAALREAVALVLGSEADGAGNTGEPDEANEAAENEAEDPALRPARGRPRTSGTSPRSTPENSTADNGPGEPGAQGAEPANSDSRATTEPRRKGLLRRFRGD
jgi:hypothetical protein